MFTSNGVNFIKEDQTGFLSPCHLEKFTDHPGTLGYRQTNGIIYLSQAPNNKKNIYIFSVIHGFLLKRKSTYLSNILLDKLRSDDSYEAGISAVSHSSGTQGFPRTGRPEQQHALWRLNTQVHKALRLEL